MKALKMGKIFKWLGKVPLGQRRTNMLVLFLALGMFATEEPGRFSTILAVAQSDLLNALRFSCGGLLRPPTTNLKGRYPAAAEALRTPVSCKRGLGHTPPPKPN
jgi:hypothetical protein